MRNTTLLIILLITSLSFSQTLTGKKALKKFKYSKNSEITVYYNDSITYKKNNKPTGVFLNSKFISTNLSLITINQEQIESLNIEKTTFKIEGKEYYGKILIKMKAGYKSNFISLNTLSAKHLNLNKNPIIFKIDDKIISEDYDSYLIDETFVLRIIVNKLKTSEKNTEINLVTVITKTKVNIEKSNKKKIIIRGNEILLSEN
ncbi:hypothetical protein [Lacinutrix algicola]|uniref:hypothetical protein n=1 Tax=Lacinutrix algicola TaxID=342954 RepID=UPI0006E1CA3C|nr:hypothetical protein [Lacinutrix algicola]